MAEGWHLWLSMMAMKTESTFTGLIGHNTEELVTQEE